MSPRIGRSRRQAVDPRWDLRAQRARTLLGERPHTEPLLQFYLALLELQTAVCAPIDVARWMPAVESPGDPDAPRLRLERLPLGELSAEFSTFCRKMPNSAPDPVRQATRAIAGASDAIRIDLLLSLLAGTDLDGLADTLSCAPAPLAFLPRGFLSPTAESLTALVSISMPGTTGTPTPAPVCPQCGWPPQVSKLEDEAHTQGVRRLICAFCAADWIFPRSVCPACGISGEEGLQFHVDDDLTHVRIEACKTCRRYLKSVDLRVIGFAEPLVDDLATPELDLWATEQGLEKITPNLLGL